MAYHIKPFQLLGAPPWLISERYDVEGKTETKAGFEDLTTMLQPLFEDRLQLKFHYQARELPVYWLEVTKPGKIVESEGQCERPSGNGPPPTLSAQPNGPCGSLWAIPGHLVGRKAAISRLVDALSLVTNQIVLDKTGLKGTYDINLEYTSVFELPPAAGIAGIDAPPGLPPLPPIDPNGPTLLTALQERLGLKLESQKGQVEVMVIDHVERPTDN